jgi:ArsR family transcriptional regulator, arsenate/arsenite/antimonite-responsive transcriptional repressor
MDESDVAQTCAALAHAKRIAILMLLQRQDNGLAVGEIAVALGLRQNSVSSHLKILSHSDLLVGHRFGREIRYRAAQRRLAHLVWFFTSTLNADEQAST